MDFLFLTDAVNFKKFDITVFVILNGFTRISCYYAVAVIYKVNSSVIHRKIIKEFAHTVRFWGRIGT